MLGNKEYNGIRQQSYCGLHSFCFFQWALGSLYFPNHPILMYKTHTHTHIGAAVKQCILRQLHHKTDYLGFPFIRKPILSRKKSKKNIRFSFFFFLSQRSCETISSFDTFVEISKQCFPMQPWKNPPLYSSTQTYFRISKKQCSVSRL